MKLFSVFFFVLLDHACAYLDDEDTPHEALMRLKNMKSEAVKTFPFQDIPLKDDESVVEKYLCPAENVEDIADIEEASKRNYKLKYCLFKKDFQRNENRICKKEVKFVFHKLMKLENNGLCGTTPFQSFYGFSYNDCGELSDVLKQLQNLKKQNKLFTYPINTDLTYPYKICYDTVGKLVLYTKHLIQTPHLFQNPYFQNEQPLPATKISTTSFFMDDDLFLIIKKRYEEENAKDASKPGTFVMVPQPLVPPGHIAIPMRKIATHHYINMAPLWEKLVPLVTAIDEGIKQSLLKDPKSGTEFIILTRVTTSNNVDTSSKIWFNLSLFQENIWCKLVYRRRIKAAVLIIIHNTPGNPPPAERGCLVGKQRKCDFQTWSKNEEVRGRITLDDTKYAFCCEVTAEDIKIIFSVDDYKVNEYLEINFSETKPKAEGLD